MEKILLVSIVAITFIGPALAAGIQHPRVALRKAVLWTGIGVLAYLASVVFIYPRLVE